MPGTFIYLPPTEGGSISGYWADAVASSGALPAAGDNVGQVIFVINTATLYYWDGAAWQGLVDGLADVSGPASSTANAVARFNGTTGKIVKNSAVTIDDSGNIATAGTVDGVDVSTLPGLISAAQADADQALIDAAAAQTTANGAIQGPASSTDEALVRFDGTDGKLAQNSAVTLNNAGGMIFTGTTGFLRLPVLTTTERDALTPLSGMVVFNSTTNRPEFYCGAPDSVWVGIGWGN